VTLLAEITTRELAARFAAGPVVALLPVGSVEPHGPHLPLATDTLIGERVAKEAVLLLAERGIDAVIAPSFAYGVTDFAKGFAGAVSLPREALVAALGAVAAALLAAGFAHVGLISNHLEPAHDEAVRASVAALGARASVTSPLTRRHARTLSDEFKSGACHAGRYETSLVLSARPDLVREDLARGLPALGLSLSDGIRAGIATFAELGMADAYTGAPADASREEGDDLARRLAHAVVIEVSEALRSP